MNKRWWESGTCFICDRWWLILAILILLIAAYFSRRLWLPPEAVLPAATIELPTFPVPDTSTPVPSNTSVPPSPVPNTPTPVPTQILGTGDVQVTLHWGSVNDLDLMVTDPDGAVIDYRSKQSPSGGNLDVDANPACAKPNTQPVENIFWPTGEAPRGNYQVSVVYFKICDPNLETPFTVEVKVDGVTQIFDGIAKVEKEVIPIHEFTR